MERKGENYVLSATLDEWLEFRMKKNMSAFMLWKEEVALFCTNNHSNCLWIRMNVTVLWRQSRTESTAGTRTWCRMWSCRSSRWPRRRPMSRAHARPQPQWHQGPQHPTLQYEFICSWWLWVYPYFETLLTFSNTNDMIKLPRFMKGNHRKRKKHVSQLSKINLSPVDLCTTVIQVSR